jgi:pimeloyl-ACP methyl ester carboxylesterase
MKYIMLSVLLVFPFLVRGQVSVHFYADDSLEINADFYQADPFSPYIIFMHQAGSSRGEYKEIASRFTKMKYNGLAVDLRSGSESNYIQNETAKRARQMHLPHKMKDARKDVIAAVNYAYKISGKPVILFGSSYTATLALEVAKDNPKVSAVVAFSPGEYFGGHSVKETISGLSKPYFVTGAIKEKPYITELMSGTNSPQGILFFPEEGKGRHGASNLWKKSADASEYWLALIVFFRSLENN